jgi:hypothetical protein
MDKATAKADVVPVKAAYGPAPPYRSLPFEQPPYDMDAVPDGSGNGNKSQPKLVAAAL